MNHYLWWFKHALIAILSMIFLVVGVQTLIAAYRLANPLVFIMTFFSASLIILISLVGIAYPVIQVYTLLKQK
jgi:di/tricarboxylate transporter